jgi:hypothetical protein
MRDRQAGSGKRSLRDGFAKDAEGANKLLLLLLEGRDGSGGIW